MIDQNRESREILRLGLQRSPRPIREKKKNLRCFPGGKKIRPRRWLSEGPIATPWARGTAPATLAAVAPNARLAWYVELSRARCVSEPRRAHGGVSAPRMPLIIPSRWHRRPASLRGRSARRPAPAPPSLSVRALPPPSPPRAPPRLHTSASASREASRARGARVPTPPPRPPRASRLVTRKRRAANADGGISAFRPPRRSPDHPRYLISLGAEPLQNRSARWCSAT